MADSLKEQHVELNLEKLHEERVVHGLYLMSMLEHASLHKLYLELEVGTSYQHETLRFVVYTLSWNGICICKALECHNCAVILVTGTSFWRCCPLLGPMTP